MSRLIHSTAIGALLFGAAQLQANSGTQLPLNQFQAGTETVDNTVVQNGGFEQPGVAGPDATGWNRTDGMAVAAPDPLHLPNPASAIGSFSARANLTSVFNNELYSQTINLAPNTDYVISGYVWNYALQGPPPPNDLNSGDLAVLQLKDATNLFNTAGVILEKQALDGGDGANGYFLYKSFNSAQFPSGVILEVLADPNENLPGGRPALLAQFDNVALTPVSAFSAQKWNVNASGSWSNSANWLNGAPGGFDAIASFTNVITSAATVTLDAPQTVAVINFDNANSYTIAGAATLTLTHEENRDATLINVLQGSHTIATPVVIGQPTDTASFRRLFKVTTAGANSVMTLSNDVVSSGVQFYNLTKAGAGRLDMKNLRVNRLEVAEGTVRVLATATANDTAATSKVSELAIAGTAAAPTARLDLGNNSLAYDYGGDTPIGDIRLLLLSGYNAGAWNGNGIASHKAAASPGAGEGGKTAIGYAEASALGLVTFGGQVVDASTIVMKYTYSGDTDLNGQVDITDLGNLATNWQSAALWTGGDLDYSGFVDITDLGLLATNWQVGVGAPLGPESLSEALASLGLPGAAVPEPATALGMVLTGLAMLARKHRRCRPA